MGSHQKNENKNKNQFNMVLWDAYKSESTMAFFLLSIICVVLIPIIDNEVSYNTLQIMYPLELSLTDYIFNSSFVFPITLLEVLD